MHIQSKTQPQRRSRLQRLFGYLVSWYAKRRRRASMRRIPDELLQDVIGDSEELSREMSKRQNVLKTADWLNGRLAGTRNHSKL